MTSNPDTLPLSVETLAIQFMHLIQQTDGTVISRQMTDSTLRGLMTLVVQVYSQKVALGEQEPPMLDRSKVTTTEVAIFVDHMLRSVDLELFEIQMWRSLGADH